MVIGKPTRPYLLRVGLGLPLDVPTPFLSLGVDLVYADIWRFCMSTPTEVVSAKVTPELRQKLERLAQAGERSLSAECRVALESWIMRDHVEWGRRYIEPTN